jgi:protein-S-isoprenylcysteine O-methyltransferase Ste14
VRKFLGISAMAVLLFGGVFALVPALIVRINERWDLPRWEVFPAQVVGLALMAAGVFLYVYCAFIFVRRGRGTPSPVVPTQQLVTDGIFGYSRNPIYVGYVAFLMGEFLLFGHLLLFGYAVLIALIIQALVVKWEEPDLTRRFGVEYQAYMRRVPRWIGLPR